MEDQKLITCPYNESHQLRSSRMQYHLIKCRKQFPTEEKKICPFDATHHVPEPEFEYHLATCEKRRIVELQKYRIDDRNQVTGCLELVDYQNEETENEENWDNECFVERTYNPDITTTQNKLFRRLHGESEARRKEFKLAERKRFERLDQGLQPEPSNYVGTQVGLCHSPIPAKNQQLHQIRTQPRQQPEILQHILNVNPRLGAGRGLVSGATNMNGVGPSGAAQLPSDSTAVSGRGGGRGAASRGSSSFEKSLPGFKLEPKTQGNTLQRIIAGRGRGMALVSEPANAANSNNASTDDDECKPANPAAVKRGLEKKLRQILKLEEKASEGEVLSAEEEEKISTKDELLEKLNNLRL